MSSQYVRRLSPLLQAQTVSFLNSSQMVDVGNRGKIEPEGVHLLMQTHKKIDASGIVFP